MLPTGEVAKEAGDDVGVGQLLEDGPFALETGHRIGAVVVKSGKRPGLLEHDLPSGPVVSGEVDTAAVGEVQRFFDLVGEVRRRLVPARCNPLGQESGNLDPGRDLEARLPHVGDESTVRAGNRKHELTSLVQAVSQSKAAVSNIEWAGFQPQVAQDVRSLLPLEVRREVGEGAFQLGLSHRIERAELTA